MANIRAGTAYIDVKLGAIDDFKNKLKNEVEQAGKDAGKTLGGSVKKSVPKNMGSDIGKQLNKDLTKAFFQDAKTDMNAGFKALASGDLQSAKGLFKSAGRNLASSLKGGFDTVTKTIGDKLGPIGDKLVALGNKAGTAAQRGWSKFQEFGKVLDKTSQKMGYLSFQIQNFGLIATVAFTAPQAAALTFGAIIGIKTAADIENATNALKYLLPAGTDVAAVLKRIQKIAIESPVFDTADLLQYTQTFTSAGVEISKTERFLKAFSNIALVTGTSTDKANLSVRAITQAFGKGKLMAEELNQQLGEAMPSVLRLLRDELHVTQPELNALVKEGKITGEDLIAIFTRIGESEKFLKGAASGAQTLSGVWQQLKEQIQTQLGLFFLKNSEKIKKGIVDLIPIFQKLIDESGPVFLKLIDGFASLVKWVGKVMDWFERLSPVQKKLAIGFLGFLSVIGPIVVVIGSLAGAFAGLAAGIAAIATPVGAIVVAIIAFGVEVTAAIIIMKKFLTGNSETAKAIRTAWNKFFEEVIVPIREELGKLWVDIKKAFDQVKNSLTENTSAWMSWWTLVKNALQSALIVIKATLIFIGGLFQTLISVVGPIIKAIASFISGLIKVFKGLTDFIIGVFTGDWQRAWLGIKEIWDGIWDAIVGTLKNLGQAILNLISGLVKSIFNFFKSLYNDLVGHSIVPDMVKAILSWFTRLVDGAKALLGALGNFISGLYNKYLAPFVNKIAGMVNSVVDRFQNLVARVKDAFSGFSLYDIGVNLIQGLINGIRDMAGYLYNVASNIASTVIDRVSGIFDIGSPSKVFYKIGEWNVQGLANGMKDTLPTANKAVSALGKMIPGVTPTFGSISDPLMDRGGASAALAIENYYANDNVDPWRQAEDWYFLVSARGGAS